MLYAKVIKRTHIFETLLSSLRIQLQSFKSFIFHFLLVQNSPVSVFVLIWSNHQNNLSQTLITVITVYCQMVLELNLLSFSLQVCKFFFMLHFNFFIRLSKPFFKINLCFLQILKRYERFTPFN